MVPWSRRSVSQAPTAPGTVGGEQPGAGHDVEPKLPKPCSRGRGGRDPLSTQDRGVGSAAVTKIAGTSPPGPFMCGSTDVQG